MRPGQAKPIVRRRGAQQRVRILYKACEHVSGKSVIISANPRLTPSCSSSND
jgi:hypothetical protein